MVEKINKKKMLKETLPGLIQLAIIITIVLLFRPNFPTLLAILLTTILVSSIAKVARNSWKPKPNQGLTLLREAVTLSIVALAIWSTNQLLGGWWALGITTTIIVSMILYSKWEEYIATIKSIEVELYGATREELREKRRQNDRKI